ncbi:MAG TPA: glycosyltransferase family 1 protein [Bryobacteraceae bacterium]|nr:glycosyltransferase family 1 protein [Bryobacteraceae bacterium]
MRVVIDAVPLLIRSAGVKNYLYYWIRALREAAGAGAIRTFPDLAGLGQLNHEGSITGPVRTGAGLAALALANYTRLPVADWCARGADLFHTTNLLRRPPRRIPVTTTIHDVTCWLIPELHPAANIRADRAFAEVLRRARAAIADSENTKNDAVRVLGLRPEKITVIYPGIPEVFFAVPPEAVPAVRSRYGLSRPFLLFVGTIEPRKNIGLLLDAYGSLPVSFRQEFELVVAGPAGWASPETLARLSTIRYLGYVPESDLAPLTAAAAAFVYPSLYEGFGFPVAQAMAAGVPVITSNLSSLPEVAADAALLVDPRSPSELCDAMARLLSSSELRLELGKRGRCRAREFRWQTAAERSLNFFESVLGG